MLWTFQRAVGWCETVVVKRPTHLGVSCVKRHFFLKEKMCQCVIQDGLIPLSIEKVHILWDEKEIERSPEVKRV